MTTESESLETGSVLYDPATDRVGEYLDRAGPRAVLRPVGGGREWEADPASLRPATDRERLADDLSRPPLPVPGCPACAELAGLRETARAECDRSAETDANVLLRQHRRQEHRA